MFQPFLQFPHIRHRLSLSILLCNVAPTLFFAWTFFRLKGGPQTDADWAIGETLRQVSAAVLPAFAIFSFYRVWMWIVERAPEYFYQSCKHQHPDLVGIDPTIEFLHTQHRFEGWNFVAAVVYFIVAVAGPALR